MPLEIANIPRALKQRAQWVLWKLEIRDGIETKVPRRASDGKLAATTRPSDWTTFAKARKAVDRFDCDGIGYVFTKDDPYTGIDFDHCLLNDGALHPYVLQWIDRFASYTELSQSLTGLHVIIEGRLSGTGRRIGTTPWGGNFEVYDDKRFFAFTGNQFRDYAIEARQDELDMICEELLQKQTDHDVDSDDEDDDALLDRARRNAKFRVLYDDGDWEGIGDYQSQSEADMALMGMLTYWFGPQPSRIMHMFQRSALGQRQKAQRPDYLFRTVDEALKNQGSFYGDSTTDAGRERKVKRELHQLEIREEARRRLRARDLDDSFDRFTKGWSLEAELQLPDEDPVYRIKQLQPSGGNVLLVAALKVGKTALTLNLLRALVDDKPFLGRFKVEPLSGNVAIFNYEETPTQWRRHARKLGIKHPERAFPVHLRGAQITPIWESEFQDRIVEWMIAHEIQYWITDPTVVAWQGLVDNENDNALVAAYTSALDQVKSRAGIDELMLTHHTGRLAETTRGRGATRLEDWMDAGWYMERDEGEPNRRMSARGRDVELDAFHLEWREERWELIAGETIEQEMSLAQVQKDKELRTAVYEILAAAHPEQLSQTALRERVKATGIKGEPKWLNAKFQEYAQTPTRPGIGMRREGQRINYYWRPK